MKARKNDVCLLYSESDEGVAEQLEYALNFYSIDVWKTRNIAIGNKIVSETTRVLEKAKVVIILWSSNSIKSALLRQLAYDAKKEKKVLIPVSIENVQIPGEFIDIQPVNLIGWNGDRESEQIVKLWIIIREQVLILHKRRVRFNQATSILSILIALIGVVFTVTTPEIRCLLNLECPLENRSSEDTSIVPDTASDLPSENSSPSSNSAQPNPSPTTSNSSLPSSLRANCIRDSGEDRQEFNEIISVNRQARNPDTRYFLRINQLHSVTCQLISKNPNSIKFIYAIPDRSGLARVKISFYLDGQLTKSLILGRGEIKSVSLNMNDIRSYSVEITALQGRDDFLYFWFDSN